MASPSPAALAALKSALGDGGWTDDPSEIAPWLTEWRSRWNGHTPLMLRPRSTVEVARAVAVCAEHGVAIVPQGGDTGLVGGQIPFGEVLLSTRRLRSVRDVTPLDDAMTVEAGVTLLEAQQAAAAVDRMFPLSLAAEGSATIGGVISTNAGGTAVLRYGVMRDLVLGIEAVMPDGQLFNGLKRLRKDNTGYDLKQLLIGAEGTLGGVEAFELMKRIGVEFVLANIPDTREPLDSTPPWSVLIELVSGEPGAADAAMERLLTHAFETGLITDAVLARNDAQRAAFWKVREEQSAAQKPEGGGWKHDVSVPVSRIAEFLDEATAAVERFHPGARVSAFGHVGDGNLHYDVLCPKGGDHAAFIARWEEGSQIVHDIVARYDGSISAEHGLGRLKTDEARRYKSPLEIATMQAIRRAIDPQRIMNPAVLF